MLQVSRSGGALHLTMDRPAKLNAVSPDLVAALTEALDGLGPQDRCVVLRATGRAFSVGGDLGAVEELADDSPGGVTAALADFHASLTALMRRVETLPVPVVAAVEGIAVAGGLEIAACCDIVVASTTATFGDVHARYGLMPGAGGSVRLPRKIGVNRAKYLMLTARQVSATTMAEWGLVTVLAEPGAFEAAVDELVATLVAHSRDGLTQMKRLVDAGMELPIDRALQDEQVAANAHTASHDYAEGLAAFHQRREPTFEGAPGRAAVAGAGAGRTLGPPG